MYQLRIRTEYSFGRVYGPINKIIERLKSINCLSAGIVDNSTWGHVPFYNECKKSGIKPILGVEIIVTDDDIATKMWFLARNQKGLKELYNYTTKSHQTPFIDKKGSNPRLYRHDVLCMSQDILKFAGDITDGEFLKDCGAYIDLNPGSNLLNIKKKRMAEQYGIGDKLFSTSDNYYPKEDDKDIFEILVHGGLKPSKQYILETLEGQDISKQIDDLCESYELPKAPMIHMEGDLEKLCRDGIKFREMEVIWDEVYETRLKYELDLIHQKDFESYFLVVADMVNFAKQHMLVGPSRGSSAGSLVCYLARITEIDPIPSKLYFERFIDVSRSDLPDIDLDFPDNKRILIFEYMAEKYGIDNTAHIGTISKLKSKSALIHACKALNIPPSATAAVKVAMIERSSADARASNCLQDTLETTGPGKLFVQSYPQAKLAMNIEGHARHTGVHAAGLLVCNDIISNYCTVDNNGIAHIEKKAAEQLGLLKIDVLGLRTLGILEDSGVNIDWYNLKFDDQETLDIFNNNRLSCIFQFEGQAMQSVAEFVKFKSLTQIDAVTALARPGPFGGGVTQKYLEREAGKEYEPIHPLVQEFMKETHGLPIYQEQTISIVKHIGLFNWEETNAVRKGMSKSLGEEFFHQYKEKFIQGAVSQGIEPGKAEEIWLLISTMGSWQMNKSHTYSYAVISYWTAYLKAHYLLDFAAANLRNAKDEESALLLLRELVKEGVEYIPFDINLSEMNWSVKDGKLVGGFMALKGIGENKAKKLIEARNNGGLTSKQIESVNNSQCVFNDIFPINTLYGDMYENPEKYNISGEIIHIEELKEGMPHCCERVFICELVHKNPRNANEENEIKKRGGKIETGQLEYLDVRLRDDTGIIGGRIGRRDYFRLDAPGMIQNVPIGSYLLIRAQFFNGIRYAFIKKWKQLKLAN